MSILVTGGAGYIGSHMVSRLADAGEEVIVLDTLATGFPWLVDHRACLIEGDAGDMALVERLSNDHSIEAILHFAGSVIVPESVVDPLKYYWNNTATTRNLIEAATRAGVDKIIFSSTAAVYGMTGLDAVSEENRLRPISPYGRSKLMSEMMLADVAGATGLRYGILRYFNVAGADPLGRTGQATARATHLVKLACQTALGLRPCMEVFGTDYPTRDGTCIRDFIHVTDLVEAHWLMLERLRQGGESATLNCGYGTGYSVHEVIDAVKAASGVDFPVVLQPRRIGDPASVVAAAGRIRSELGWEPAHASLEDIVHSALGWEHYLNTLETRPEVA
jgi:UDP-glucose 4-epimerase